MTMALADAAPGTADVPRRLLQALRAAAGGPVDGAAPGQVDGAPDTAPLAPARAAAVLAAWTGTRLHAGRPGALRCDDPDLALLVGDWCFAHALQALAQSADLDAIGVLAAAIGECAVALTEEPGADGLLASIWAATVVRLTVLA